MKKTLRFSAVILSIFLFLSCKEEPVPPIISTRAVTDITTTTAISGGVITDDGGAKIISKGICWNISDNPTIENSKTTETGESGSFTSHLSDLSPNTLYYVRAYATNSAGTGYGNSLFFTTLGDKPASNVSNASNIQVYSATLNGSVNPNQLSTTVTFEWGTTTNYGNTFTPSQSPITGSASVNVSADISGLTPGTTYHFRIKAENSLGITYSSDMTFTTLGQVPAAVTESVTNLKINTATLNGSVNPNYLSTTVTFEWGTTTYYGNSSTIAQSPITGSTSVDVSADLSGLIPMTTYHFRIKATNELGTTNGDDLIFTTYALADIDNNFYYSAIIGTQIWMTENLKTTRYNDGTAIPLVTDNTVWAALYTPGYCWYNNDSVTYNTTYGKLYNWYTVNTSEICPIRWHVPTDADWVTLTTYLGGISVAGGHLKEIGVTHWTFPNTGADNSSGFSALPGGRRSDDGTFDCFPNYGHWWSSTENGTSDAWGRSLGHNDSGVVRYLGLKIQGLSIRCLKD